MPLGTSQEKRKKIISRSNMFEREGMFWRSWAGSAHLFVPLPCPHLLVDVGVGHVLDESALHPCLEHLLGVGFHALRDAEVLHLSAGELRGQHREQAYGAALHGGVLAFFMLLCCHAAAYASAGTSVDPELVSWDFG